MVGSAAIYGLPALYILGRSASGYPATCICRALSRPSTSRPRLLPNPSGSLTNTFVDSPSAQSYLTAPGKYGSERGVDVTGVLRVFAAVGSFSLLGVCAPLPFSAVPVVFFADDRFV